MLWLAAALVSGCSPVTSESAGPPSPTVSIEKSVQPVSVRGTPIQYQTVRGIAIRDQSPMFFELISAAGAELAASSVTVGLGPGDFTITVIRLPGGDPGKAIDPLIADVGTHPVGRATALVGGKHVLQLLLPPTTPDWAYIYTVGDTLVYLYTADPTLAEEAFSAMP